MKKLLSLLCLFTVLNNIPAETEPYNWYFKANKNHDQPTVFDGNPMPDKYGALYLGNKDEKTIYLTFDAGYENGNVLKIVDILNEKSVVGSFFILPELPKRYPSLVKKMCESGHTVCNHSYSHRDMSVMSEEEILEELTSAEKICEERAGVKMSKFVRPPEGRFSEKTLRVLHDNGYVPVFWSYAYADWDNTCQPDAEYALGRIKSNIHNGMVVLLHPTSETNTKILGDFIDYAKSEGYVFGSLDMLLIEKHISP